MAVLTGLFSIGRDAELRHTQGGDAVVTISLGYNYVRKDAEGKYPVMWVRASLWGKLAESLHTYLTKGKQVDAILEDVHIRTYEKNGGGTGFNMEGRVLKIELARGQRQDENGAAPAPAPRPAPAPSPRPAPPRQGSGGFDDMPDDIPYIDPMRRSLRLYSVI